MNDKNKRTPGATVEMPVQLALMIARDERAVSAFGALDEKRREEYVRRGQLATDKKQLRDVVRDIIAIG